MVAAIASVLSVAAVGREGEGEGGGKGGGEGGGEGGGKGGGYQSNE